MGTITYNNVSSANLNIHISKQPDREFPERQVEKVDIPGRNGSLIFDTGVYKNVERNYSIWAGPEAGDFTTLASKISKWLHSAKGYAILRDSYEPGIYRMASYIEEGSIENILNEAGKIDISFNCKPQRFLDSGDVSIEIISTQRINNDTGYISKPIIKAIYMGFDVGYFRLNNSYYNVYFKKEGESEHVDNIIIDCENMNCYRIDGSTGNVTNENSRFSSSDFNYPELKTGETEIQIYNDASSGTKSCKLEVYPKWYII